VAVPAPTLLAGERERRVGVDAVELALGGAVVGLEQRLEGVVDGETLVDVPDSVPTEIDVDQALCRDGAVLAGERTERADAGQSRRDGDAEPIVDSPSGVSYDS
jgi:hypothetical protein